MRKYFFCAKNIEDYRKVYGAKASTPALEQLLFREFLKKLYNVTDVVFDSPLSEGTDVEGLRYDFNFGLRLDVPDGNFRVRISDADSGIIFFDKYVPQAVRLISVEQYFIRWRIEIFRDGKEVFKHTLDLNRRKVLLLINGGLGDTLALLPSAREFKRRHNCELFISLPSDSLSELVARLYPELIQVSRAVPRTYAVYFPSMFTSNLMIAPADYRNMPMERMGGALLGLNLLPAKPTFKPTARRPISEPYVCIGVQASGTRKGWLYPGGWDVVVDYLKRLGYRVLCIDKIAEQTNDGITISKLEGAEDFTGDLPIMDRANMLYHAEFFIGLSSGLAWVADAVNCPVVLICGFSKDWFEFHTPYRVINRLVCNGCFNDLRVDYKKTKCPYHEGTERELECQKKISPRQVINAIDRLIADRHKRSC